MIEPVLCKGSQLTDRKCTNLLPAAGGYHNGFCDGCWYPGVELQLVEENRMRANAELNPFEEDPLEK